jgi:hypothetical protein
MSDLFALHVDLMNGNVFLPRSLHLGFLLCLSLFSFLPAFLFCFFVAALLTILVQNPLLKSDVFGLHADLMKGDVFWVLSLLPLFHFFSFTHSCCSFHSYGRARVLTLVFFSFSLLAFLFYFLLPPC